MVNDSNKREDAPRSLDSLASVKASGGANPSIISDTLVRRQLGKGSREKDSATESVDSISVSASDGSSMVMIALKTSAKLRFILSGVLAVASLTAFIALLLDPGEQPTNLILIISAVSSIAVAFFEATSITRHALWSRSPFTALPILGVLSVALAAISAAAYGTPAVPLLIPLVATAPLFAAATLLLGSAFTAKSRALSRSDGDYLFPTCQLSVNTGARNRGDTITVKSGDIIPADGRLQRGCIAVDERTISPVPLFRIHEEGDVVYAGSEVLNGEAEVVTLSSANESTLRGVQERIAPFIRAAEDGLAFEDARASRWSALAILFLALSAGIFWHERVPGLVEAALAFGTVALFGGVCELSLSLHAMRRALIRRWVSRGLVLTSASACKDLALIEGVICDPSRFQEGSLLKGSRFEVLDDRLSDDALCNFIAALLGRAEDPILIAAGEFVRRIGGSPSVERVVDLREYSGRGICGTVHGVELSIGGEDFFVERGIMVQPNDGTADAAEDGERVVLVAIDDDVVARIHIVSGQLELMPNSGEVSSWESSGVNVSVSDCVAYAYGEESLLIRGRESDLLGVAARRECVVFNPAERKIREATVVAFTDELSGLDLLLAECHADNRNVDRFRLLVGFGGLTLVVAAFCGANTPLIPLLLVAFIGAVVYRSGATGATRG
jgi:cation transport ATPase